jgi:hypothetical protein
MTNENEPNGGAQTEGARSESHELAYDEVCTANGEVEANGIKSALEAAGIPVEFQYESVSTVLPVSVDGLGAVKVMVPTERLEEARAIVETPAEPVGDGE